MNSFTRRLQFSQLMAARLVAKAVFATREGCVMNRACVSAGVLVCCALAWIVPPAQGEGDPVDDGRASPARAKSLLAVEVAEVAFADAVTKSFRKEADVELEVLQTQMRGEAIIEGRYSLHCIAPESVQSAELPAGVAICFLVRANGTSVSRTQGSHGPAEIHNTIHSRFKATKLLWVQDGRLKLGTTAVEVETDSVTPRISSRWRVGRRLVCRIAHNKVEQGRGDITSASEDRTHRRITGAVDSSVEKLCRRVADRAEGVAPAARWMVSAISPYSVEVATVDGAVRVTLFGSKTDWTADSEVAGQGRMFTVGPFFSGIHLSVARPAVAGFSEALPSGLRLATDTASVVTGMLPATGAGTSWFLTALSGAAEALDGVPEEGPTFATAEKESPAKRF